MTAQSERPLLRGRQTQYEAPALHAAEAHEYPHTLCATCPASLWFQRNTWQCFCDVMKIETYGGKLAAVTVCDGRERAIVRLEQLEADA